MNPKDIKKGIGIMLGAAVLTTSVVPAMADSEYITFSGNGDEENTAKNVQETSSVQAKDPENLEQAKKLLSEKEDTLKKAEEAKNAAADAVNNSTAKKESSEKEKNTAEANLTKAQEEAINEFSNVVEKNSKAYNEKNEAFQKAKKELSDAETEKAAADKEKEDTDAAYEKAEADRKTAYEDYTNTKNTYSEELKKLNEAKKTAASKEEEYNKAKQSYDELEAKLSDLESTKEKAEARKDAAKKALKEAEQNAYNTNEKVKELTDWLENNGEDSEEYREKKEAYEQANADYEEARQKEKEAEDALDTAELEREQAYKKYNDASALLLQKRQLEGAVEMAQDDLTAAQKDLKDKQVSVRACKNLLAMREEEYNEAKEKEAEASQKAEGIDERISAAEKALEEAQARYDAGKESAQKAYDDAKAEWDQLGVKFLQEHMTTTKSIEQMMEDTINNDWLKIGGINGGVFKSEEDVEKFKSFLKDMLSVDNLLKSAETAKIGNDCRVEEGKTGTPYYGNIDNRGLTGLKLDYNLMAFSAICNAVNAVNPNIPHVASTQINKIFETDTSGNAYDGKTITGENLVSAMIPSGYEEYGPYAHWYYIEKENWMKEVEKKEADPDYVMKEQGHYKALVDPRYKTTGVSWDGHHGEQFFAAADWGPTCTPDEFIEALDAYSRSYREVLESAKKTNDTLDNDLKNAQQKLASEKETKKQAEEAAAALITAKEKLDQKTADLNTANEELNASQKTYDNAAAELDTANQEYAKFLAEHEGKDIEAEVEQAKEEKGAKDKALNAAWDALDAASDNTSKASSKKSSTQRAYQNLQKEVVKKNTQLQQEEMAIKEYYDAYNEYNEATTNYETVMDLVKNQEEARKELQTKKDTLDTLGTEKEAANAAVKNHEDAVNALRPEVQGKSQILSSKTETANKAKAASDEAKTRQQQAETNLSEKQEAYNQAEKELETAKTKYENAKKVKREDPSTYEENFPELKTLEENIQKAEKELEEKKDALKKAEQETAEANEAYDKAQKEYALAIADYNIAKGFVDKYTVYDISKEPGMKISGITNKVYTGKAIKQSIKVTHNGNPVTYTVTYSGGNTAIGKHQIIIRGTGKYTGTKVYNYTIVPKTAGNIKYKKAKTSITVSYKKVSGVSGYQIGYRVKGTSKWKYKTVTGKSAKLKSLKRKKTYEIRVRTYKKVNGVKYHSSWSKTSKVKTK